MNFNLNSLVLTYLILQSFFFIKLSGIKGSERGSKEYIHECKYDQQSGNKSRKIFHVCTYLPAPSVQSSQSCSELCSIISMSVIYITHIAVLVFTCHLEELLSSMCIVGFHIRVVEIFIY